MTSDLRLNGRMFRVTAFMYDSKPRYIFQHVETLAPSTALSLYESWLSRTHSSFNSTRNALSNLVYLYSWALEMNINIEEILLNGEALTPAEIRNFSLWLEITRCIDKAKNQVAAIATHNSILSTSCALCCWFIQQFGVFHGERNEVQDSRARVIESIQEAFKNVKKTERKIHFAGDLTEEEIKTIEQYLKPTNRKDVDAAIAVRDYLVWRLAIEFGLREGEIRALRLQDCPHRQQNYISVVRIEERGEDYYDPRGVYMPRPKTLSRDIGFLISHSETRKYINDYIARYRVRRKKRLGKVYFEPILDHDFLIVSYLHKSGEPLSGSAMQKIAQGISKATGIAFHWHLARHAFFNRNYAAIADDPDNNARMMDLVYMGGWSDEKSLELYVNRARRERARTAIKFWQNGGSTWDALK